MVTTRIHAAAAAPQLVVGASGLVAAFNDAGSLSPLDVHSSTVISRLWGETHPQVILAAALAVRGTRFGHVCIRLGHQREVMAVEGQPPEVLESLPWPDPDEWTSAVSASSMVGDGSGEEPLVLAEDRLYLERYFRHEERIAGLIRSRIAASRTELDPKIEAVLRDLLPPTFDGRPNLQHLAATSVLAGSFTVIAGGPGTGKTYTVARTLAALAYQADFFPRVAVCAPTGKAAARLKEVVEQFSAGIDNRLVRHRLEKVQMSTIHRLLGWAWGRGRFLHHERNRLPHDLVIVDETSMVSLPLAAKLMAAIRPDAKLVLAGDPHQLDSIEAGTVLADIVGPATGDPDSERPRWQAPPRKTPRVVVLERVHRFAKGSPIADFSDAVRDGDAGRAVDLLDRHPPTLTWVRERSGEPNRRLLERVIGHRAKLAEQASKPWNSRTASLSLLGEIVVLCAHRQGPGSVDGWRRDIEAALDERFPGLRYGGDWYPGRPLMITANDYNLDLYNGDIGVAVRTPEGLRAVFDRGGTRSFPPSYLGDHSTVHALTIHKSQGSQFEEVVVSLPPESSRLLTRELLYTAVTRATDRVTIVGEESVIRMAVERSVQRASGLRSKLWGSD